MTESYGLTSETFTTDNLFAGHEGIVTDTIVLITGQDLDRGSLLGKITASGKYTLSLSAAGDGSEVPVEILARDTDASAGDVETTSYRAGQFNENALNIGTGHTAASVKEGLRALGIFLKSSVEA